MQEPKEESKDTGKKRKIVIKPKASVVIATKEGTIFDDLIEMNREYLKEIFTETQLEELKKRYTINEENREKNIYNFIDAYRCMIKQQFNEETQSSPCANNELLNRITIIPFNLCA